MPTHSPFDPAGAVFDPDRFEAQLRGLDSSEAFVFGTDEVPAHFVRASVLICFWQDAEDVRVLMTRRAATLRGHPGQMSFPGGKLEAGEDWSGGALRETEEEVGIPRETVRVLGRLDDAWSGSGHWLVPIVGWLDAPPRFRINPDEVESLHTPGVRELLAPSAYSREAADLDGDRYYNATLRWSDGQVFGLSTDLLIEALERGLGRDAHPGPERLNSLRSWLRMKAKSNPA